MNKKKAVIVALSALFVLLCIIYVYRISTRNAVEQLVENKKMINILVAANNSYHGNKYSFYAIVSINPETHRFGMTFLPPQTRIDFSGRGKSFTRLDEVDMHDFPALSKALSRDLKIKIPFYVSLYAPDIERCIDLFEGVDLFMLDQMQGVQGLHFGVNYLDGRKTVEYINHVEGGSIFKKYDRIMDILFTLYDGRERYKKYATNGMITELFSTVKTNMLRQEQYSLAKLLLADAELLAVVLPGNFDEKGFYYVDDITYKMYEKDFLKRLILPGKDVPAIKVKLLNGTDIPGLARKVRAGLIRENINVVEFGTSPFPEIEKTVIINQSGDVLAAKKISEFLGVTNVRHIVDSTQLHSVLIIVGKDLSE